MANTENEISLQLLMVSLGQCIMQWAQVELHLGLLFHTLFGPDHEAAEILWGRIRSFDAKLQLMNELAAIRLKDETQKRDWNLLRHRTAALYGKRNKVAHSTPITAPDGSSVLEPFSVPFRPSPTTLSADDLNEFSMEFTQLASALLHINMIEVQASQQKESPAREHDLLLRLRKEDDRKREEQRHRALAWRQYLQQNPKLVFD